MNICIVTHKLLKGDGQARVNYEIVKEVLNRNHIVTVLASYVAPELLSMPNLNWIKVPIKGWPTQLLKNQIFALISTVLLFIHRRKFDLVMVNGFITWAKSDVNAVHFVHSSWLKSRAHPFRLRKNGFGYYQLLFTYINSIFEKVAFSRSKQLVPVSEKVKTEIQQFANHSNLRVIMNGVDTREFYPDQSISRGQLGLPEKVTLALFAGDIKSSRKNLDSVLKAMVNIKDLHLAVAGSTNGSPYIKLAEQLGLKDRVQFLGFRKDMANLMRAVDFFVFPSRYEACTLVVIEALASGLPVITTYQSGVSELITSDLTAGIVLADPEDVDGLGQAMKQLSEHPELRQHMGSNARKVSEKQRWEKVAGEYITLFEERVEKKKEPVKLLGFATQGSNGDDENRLRALLSNFSVNFYPFGRQRKLLNTWKIFRYIFRERPNLIIMEGTGIAGGMALIAGNILIKVPYVVSSGDAVGPFISSQFPLLGPFFNLYEKLLYKRSIGFIGWTPYLAGRALTYGTTFGMTAAGWAPFSYSEEELKKDRSRIRSSLGIPESQIVIGIVGSLNWNHRIGYCYGYELVMALLKLKRRDVTVLIVGDGNGKAKLEELAGDHPNIIFTGRLPREEVPSYLSAMDLASLPQSVDQVGSFRYTTKVSEYLSVGLPIVTGNIPMSYDLDKNWIYRLHGSKPWDRTYTQSMVDFLEQITLKEVKERSRRVPRNLSLFDKEKQINNVSEFIRDILMYKRGS